MKNIWKLFFVPVAAALVFAACAPEEKLDLAGYPETRLELSISDLKTPTQLLELTAVYDSESKLVLDGELTHRYLLKLDKPSSRDMKLKVEPIAVNLPADKVTISETNFILPAGEVSLPITVTLSDEDFRLAASDKDAKVYELGVKLIEVQGYNTIAEIGSEAKVVISKERYNASLSLTNPTAAFKRSYWDGALDTNDPLVHTFKAKLDRPASKDIILTFATEGISDAFAGDITMTPETITIPAGGVESEDITWTAATDFLLSGNEAKKYVLTLKPTITSDDPYVEFAAEGPGEIVISVDKSLNGLTLVSPLPDTWSAFDRTGWIASDGGGIWSSESGTMSDVLNDSYASYINGSNFAVILDMLEPKNMAGITSYYRGFFETGSTSSYYPRNVKFYISDDKETWTQVGDVDVPRTGDLDVRVGHTFRFLTPFTARYVKFEVSGGTTRLAILRIYEKP